jgi:hypothetical protein
MPRQHLPFRRTQPLVRLDDGQTDNRCGSLWVISDLFYLTPFFGINSLAACKPQAGYLIVSTWHQPPGRQIPCSAKFIVSKATYRYSLAFGRNPSLDTSVQSDSSPGWRDGVSHVVVLLFEVQENEF